MSSWDNCICGQCSLDRSGSRDSSCTTLVRHSTPPWDIFTWREGVCSANRRIEWSQEVRGCPEQWAQWMGKSSILTPQTDSPKQQLEWLELTRKCEGKRNDEIANDRTTRQTRNIEVLAGKTLKHQHNVLNNHHSCERTCNANDLDFTLLCHGKCKKENYDRVQHWHTDSLPSYKKKLQVLTVHIFD